MHRICDDCYGDVEKKQAQSDSEPKQEWDDPILVVTARVMKDKACDPPSKFGESAFRMIEGRADRIVDIF